MTALGQQVVISWVQLQNIFFAGRNGESEESVQNNTIYDPILK